MWAQILVSRKVFTCWHASTSHSHILSNFSSRSLHEIRLCCQSVSLLVPLIKPPRLTLLNKMPNFDSCMSTLVVQWALFLTGCQCCSRHFLHCQALAIKNWTDWCVVIWPTFYGTLDIQSSEIAGNFLSLFLFCTIQTFGMVFKSINEDAYTSSSCVKKNVTGLTP